MRRTESPQTKDHLGPTPSSGGACYYWGAGTGVRTPGTGVRTVEAQNEKDIGLHPEYRNLLHLSGGVWF